MSAQYAAPLASETQVVASEPSVMEKEMEMVVSGTEGSREGVPVAVRLVICQVGVLWRGRERAVVVVRRVVKRVRIWWCILGSED